MSKRTLVITGIILAAILIAAWWVWGEQSGLGSTSELITDTADVPEGMARYTHPSFRFSFLLSLRTRATTRYEPGGAETVVFTDASTDPAREMQLYIIPYTGRQIGSSQIAKDTHGQATGTPQEVVLGSGVRGLLFETDDARYGRLREVWFILNGHLIEVTTSIENDTWLSQVLNTLKPNTL